MTILTHPDDEFTVRTFHHAVLQHGGDCVHGWIAVDDHSFSGFYATFACGKCGLSLTISLRIPGTTPDISLPVRSDSFMETGR